MRAGQLRHRVTIQKPTDTNTDGEVTTVWSDVAKTRAAIEPQSGREAYRAKQVHANMTHLLRLRYDSELSAMDTTWRVQFGTRNLNIAAIDNVLERNRELLLICVEAV